MEKLSAICTRTFAEAAGPLIAERLRVRYDGYWRGAPGGRVGPFMQFTDPQTGGTFAARSIEEAPRSLGRLRARFGDSKRVTI
jgi:hypothetical protein